MKIAYISADPGVPVFGRKGCSIHVQEIVRAMLKLGHEVHLFAMRLGDETRIEAARLHVHDLGPLPKGDAAAPFSLQMACTASDKPISRRRFTTE